MYDNKNNQLPESKLSSEDRDWLEDLLSGKQPEPEIGADEQAVNAAGLTSIGDMELEKILAEDWLKTPDSQEEPQPEAPAETDTPEEAPAVSDETAYFELPVKESIPEELPEELPEEEPEPVPEEDAPKMEKKIRPKRKNGYGLLGIPHILATVLWGLLILAIGVSLGRVLWVCCADVMAFDKEYQNVTITITQDDTIESISQKLGQAKLVRYPGLFKFFAEVTGKDEDISVGTFTLHSQLDYNAMINAMGSYGATREVVDVMFPDGASCALIFKLLEENNVCSVADLEEYAANGELKEYWFLEGVERGHKYCLEGYMSPDTYQFYTNDSPRRVIEKFLNEFNSRFTDIMKEEFVAMQERYANELRRGGFGEEYIANNPLTLHQLITLASIIQKETSSNSESYDIASVFYNRLTNTDFMYLNSNATVHYAIGDYFGQVKDLTEEQLNVDSPYNTRNNKGIPPGPICNFGVHPLYAALEPNDTNYYYFVYDYNAYKHLFASTYSGHMQNVAEAGG